MSNSSPRKPPPLEVSVMFEPHRQHQDLLRQAYACLISPSRRPLSSGKSASEARHVQPTMSTERSSA